MNDMEIYKRALKAADWLRTECSEYVQRRPEDGFWQIGCTPFASLWSNSGLCYFAEERGWKESEWDDDLEAEFQAFKRSPGYEEFKALIEKAAKYAFPERDLTPEETQRWVDWILDPEGGQQPQKKSILLTKEQKKKLNIGKKKPRSRWDQ